ncbi:MAG: aminoacyl-histidine dipeptidase [Ignavibacteriaceae bacterium]|nr:aminoacyl-histidine dipeptidase [Ignavibacteriaceae bacterium]
MSEQVISGLKPEILWKRFYEITKVPRPSKKEEKILKHFKELFATLNVAYKQDKTGNIVAYVPATKGRENAPVAILQGHVDMVCEKNKSTQHDFDNDALKLKKVDGWIAAEGTTLGSDNGIGIAAAVAIISDKDAVHGPLEILLTVDEETGLTGANELDPSLLKGRILLNLDSEEDGTFYVGCAGGVDTAGIFNLEFEKVPAGYDAFELMITGLKGGHSGSDINMGKANAIKLLARTLKALEPVDYKLGSLTGGSKRNAIPREAEALLLIKSSSVLQAEKLVKAFEVELVNEFKASDGGLKVEFKKISSKTDQAVTDTFKKRIVNTLLGISHGVISMSQDIPDLVETSTNLATVTFENNQLTVGTSQRSSIESARDYVAQSVGSVLELANAKVELADGYPGWKPNMSSEILNISRKVYSDLFKAEPEVKAIHAGLECGLLGDKIEGLDMISFGPTITGAHSPDEMVNIETVDKFYDLLKGILKKIAD